MFRKVLSFGGLLLLAGAAVLVTPGSSLAQPHGGGGHFSGSHIGAFHDGFHHSGFGGLQHGDFHSGFGGFHHGGFGGFHYPRYYGHYGTSPYYNYGYYPSYGYYPYDYGYSPYYGSYSDYYPYTYGSDWSSPSSDSGYYGSYGDATPSYLDSAVSVNAQPDTRAQITVSAPADAEIWFNDTKTTLTGTTLTGAVREYQSPPLTPGIRYTYEVRARWNENGHEVTQTQQVEVTAGAQVIVNFPVQPTKAPTAPSH
jgi:uncharacterized protein (TIGR03000 family)